MINWIEQTVAVDALKPYEKNPRIITPAQYKNLVDSIRDNGYHQRILATKDLRVIGGHQRIKALQEIGFAEIAILTPSDDISDEQFERLLIQDNLPFGEWDFQKLQTDFKFDKLKDWGMPVDWLAKAKPPFDEDKAEQTPEPQAKIVSASRDVWLCGAHRVMCGDSTNAEDVAALFGSDKAELLFTSPPYSDIRTYDGSSDLSPDHLSNFITVAEPFCEYQVVNLGLKRADHEVIPYWDVYIERARAAGYLFLTWGVWFRPSAGSVGNQSAFLPVTHEWMFVFGKAFKHINRCEERDAPHDGKTSRTNRQNDGSMKRSTIGVTGQLKELESVVDLSQEMNNSIRKLHPAVFPVGLPRKYILAITNEGDAVYDPFLGSGTTMIAAEQTNRKCYGMEISPAYVDVIVRRWMQFTAKTAILQATGETFEAVEMSRS